jgi:hypothetical protein
MSRKNDDSFQAGSGDSPDSRIRVERSTRNVTLKWILVLLAAIVLLAPMFWALHKNRVRTQSQIGKYPVGPIQGRHMVRRLVLNQA